MIDLENLKRVIMAGSTDAARDAGLTHFAISVSVEPVLAELPQGPAIVPQISVEIVELSEEQAVALREPEPN